ncbi:glycosyltransferase [Candidatus Hepatobacter penaei]|uniref:glycosyltransferase n=1 Tax=Candidatus Hepatobacter penaei TaxID=1274402 RepID=UPI000696087B|nr:glycosyltransferase [Candidatus Hepatobacter penaei]TGW14879.1 glycosyltransferase [bacterium NHP-B]
MATAQNTASLTRKPTAPSTTRPLKIMVVIGSLDVGGAEMDIVRNFPVLQESPDFEIVLALYTHKGTLYPRAAKAGIKILSLHSTIHPHHGVWAKWKEHVRRFAFIRRALAEEKPDIVHPFLPGAYFYACMANLLTRGARSLVMSRLSLNFYAQKRPLLAFVEQRLCHRFGPCRVVGNAKAVLDDLQKEGLPPHKLTLIYNGIETDVFTAHKTLAFYTQAPCFSLTAVGNLHPYKGYRDLLAAVATLKKQAPHLNWHLNIAGKGTPAMVATLTQDIATYGLEKHVTLLGHVADNVNLLKNTHLFIHPSHTEGLPNAIIEAMSAELPVIATQVGGIPELVEDHVTGRLVPPQDPHALARAIQEALKAPETLHAWGQKAKIKADTTFHVHHSVAAYKRLYKNMARGSCQRAASVSG